LKTEPPPEPTGLLLIVTVVGMVIFAMMAGYAIVAAFV
jgi:hypothetical protein